MEQSDREDQLTDWMDNHNIQNGWQFASTFVNAGLNSDWLDQIIAHLDEICLQDTLTWLEATLNVVGLLNTLGHSTERIHQLVGAVQDYSALDPDDLQPVDIHKGLESTLTILGHKLKRGVTIVRDYAEDLPKVMSHGSELEQVWMNVIDNAIAATLERFNQNTSSPSISSTPSLHTNPVMIPTGWQNRARHFSTVNQPTIWIRTRCEADWVLIEIADNGIGIPPEVQPHIYEPFFTTKGVGKGTGLGLNTSYKIIKRHEGDIRVTSQLGDTCFQIRFPSQC
jgi:signal transduction histidine kinase